MSQWQTWCLRAAVGALCCRLAVGVGAAATSPRWVVPTRLWVAAGLPGHAVPDAGSQHTMESGRRGSCADGSCSLHCHGNTSVSSISHSLPRESSSPAGVNTSPGEVQVPTKHLFTGPLLPRPHGLQKSLFSYRRSACCCCSVRRMLHDLERSMRPCSIRASSTLPWYPYPTLPMGIITPRGTQQFPASSPHFFPGLQAYICPPQRLDECQVFLSGTFHRFPTKVLLLWEIYANLHWWEGAGTSSFWCTSCSLTKSQPHFPEENTHKYLGAHRRVWVMVLRKGSRSPGGVVNGAAPAVELGNDAWGAQMLAPARASPLCSWFLMLGAISSLETVSQLLQKLLLANARSVLGSSSSSLSGCPCQACGKGCSGRRSRLCLLTRSCPEPARPLSCLSTRQVPGFAKLTSSESYFSLLFISFLVWNKHQGPWLCWRFSAHWSDGG